jgi:hypothetical protein
MKRLHRKIALRKKQKNHSWEKPDIGAASIGKSNST